MSGTEIRKLGKYELRATIGRGSVGIVYEGWDPLMARTVAIKTLPLGDMDELEREQYERFKREAQAAGRLHHLNIVSAYDYGETASNAYIVMEYLSGPSLKALLTKRQPLPIPQIASIMHSLLSALQHSHQRGVVHRDIKPGNVVFSADGEVKITDFGIAHLESSGMTRAGSVLGTPAYMAPEQVLGEPVDARTDVYSAGIVFYEMLTGRRPFEGSEASIMHKIVHAQPPRPSQLAPTASPGIDAIIEKVLAKNPADRFQSAAAFDDALQTELRRAPGPVGDLKDLEPTVAMNGRSGVPPTASTAASTPTHLLPPQRAAAPLPPHLLRGKWLLLLGAGVLGIGVVAWFALSPSNSGPGAERHVASAQGPINGPPAESQQPAAPRPPATTTGNAVALPVPPPVQSATDVDEPVRLRLQAIAATAPCSVIRTEATAGGHVRLAGITALGDASELEVQAMLQRGIQAAEPARSIVWDMHRVDGPYCPVLDILRPFGAAASARSGVSLSLSANGMQVMVGDPVRVVAHSLQPPAQLTLDWFGKDGLVHHVRVVSADPTVRAGEWQAQTPLGVQLITAVTSSEALFPNDRPVQEPAAGYLKDLQTALAQVRSHDAQLAAAVLSIEVTRR